MVGGEDRPAGGGHVLPAADPGPEDRAQHRAQHGLQRPVEPHRHARMLPHLGTGRAAVRTGLPEAVVVGPPPCDHRHVPVLPGAEPFQADGGDVAVLLVHGFTGTPQSLRDWAEHHAAAGLTVRLPRLPGHGTRWQELNRTRWPDWYAAVERELLALAASGHRVVVGGLSMGGALALRLAQEHPDHVAGLVLVNPAVLYEDGAWPCCPSCATSSARSRRSATTSASRARPSWPTSARRCTRRRRRCRCSRRSRPT